MSVWQRLWHQAGEAWRRTFGAAAAPSGFDAAGLDAMQAGRFSHPGRTLDYLLYLPPWRSGALLVMLHGCQQDPLDFAAGTRMNRLARAHGLLVLYPAQSAEANRHRCWNWFRLRHAQQASGELAALAALVRQVTATHRVDPHRVYVAGLSAGAAMADLLSQRHPELFAGVGVHSGVMADAAHGTLAALAVMRHGPVAALPRVPRAPLPTIVFQGDADTVVHPRNADALVAAALGPSQPGGERSESVATPQAHGYTLQRWPATAARPPVAYCRIHGSGHAWSGGSAEGSFTDPLGPDASAEMLRFLLAQRRAVAAARA